MNKKNILLLNIMLVVNTASIFAMKYPNTNIPNSKIEYALADTEKVFITLYESAQCAIYKEARLNYKQNRTDENLSRKKTTKEDFLKLNKFDIIKKCAAMQKTDVFKKYDDAKKNLALCKTKRTKYTFNSCSTELEKTTECKNWLSALHPQHKRIALNPIAQKSNDAFKDPIMSLSHEEILSTESMKQTINTIPIISNKTLHNYSEISPQQKRINNQNIVTQSETEQTFYNKQEIYNAFCQTPEFDAHEKAKERYAQHKNPETYAIMEDTAESLMKTPQGQTFLAIVEQQEKETKEYKLYYQLDLQLQALKNSSKIDNNKSKKEDIQIILLNNNQPLPKIVIEDCSFTPKSYKNINNKHLEQYNQKQ